MPKGPEQTPKLRGTFSEEKLRLKQEVIDKNFEVLKKLYEGVDKVPTDVLEGYNQIISAFNNSGVKAGLASIAELDYLAERSRLFISQQLNKLGKHPDQLAAKQPAKTAAAKSSEPSRRGKAVSLMPPKGEEAPPPIIGSAKAGSPPDVADERIKRRRDLAAMNKEVTNARIELNKLKLSPEIMAQVKEAEDAYWKASHAASSDPNLVEEVRQALGKVASLVEAHRGGTSSEPKLVSEPTRPQAPEMPVAAAIAPENVDLASKIAESKEPLVDFIRIKADEDAERKRRETQEEIARRQAVQDQRSAANREKMRNGIERSFDRKIAERDKYLSAFVEASLPNIASGTGIPEFREGPSGTVSKDENGMQLPGQEEADAYFAGMNQALEGIRPANDTGTGADMPEGRGPSTTEIPPIFDDRISKEQFAQRLQTIPPDGDVRIPEYMRASREDRATVSSVEEATPLEWRKLLRAAVEKIGDAASTPINFLVDRVESLNMKMLSSGFRTTEAPVQTPEEMKAGAENAVGLKAYLTNRDGKFVDDAKKLSKAVGAGLLKAGDKYRKMPLAYKIAISGALVTGALATGGASMLWTTVFASAKLGQRALGSLGTYAALEEMLEKRILKKEGESGNMRGKWENWKKHGFAAGAALAVFSGVPGYALKEGFEAGGEGLKFIYNAIHGPNIVTEPLPTPEPIAVPEPIMPISELAPEKEIVVEKLPPLERVPVPEPLPIPEPSTPEAIPSPEPETPASPEAAPETVAAQPEQGTVITAEELKKLPSVEAQKGEGYIALVKQLHERFADGVEFRVAAGIDPNSDLGRIMAAKDDTIGKLAQELAEKHGAIQGNESVRVLVGDRMSFDTNGNLVLGEHSQIPQEAPTTKPDLPKDAVEARIREQEIVAGRGENYEWKDLSSSSSPQTRGIWPEYSPEADTNSIEPGTEPASEGDAEEPSSLTSEKDYTKPFLNDNLVAVNPNVPGIYEMPDPQTGQKVLVAYGGSDADRFEFIQQKLLSPEYKDQKIRFAHVVSSISGPKLTVDELGAGDQGGSSFWKFGFFKTPVPPPDPETFTRSLTK